MLEFGLGLLLKSLPQVLKNWHVELARKKKVGYLLVNHAAFADLTGLEKILNNDQQS